MVYLSIFTGIILLLLGFSTWFLTGTDSPTALIPVAFGLLYITAGFIGRMDRYKKTAAYGTILLSVLGVAGTSRAIPLLTDLLNGEAIESPIAVFSQLSMMVLCGVFLILSMRALKGLRE